MTGSTRRLRTVPLALLILYTVFIGLVTLTPNQMDTGPGSFIAGLLEFLASHRVTAWIDYDILEKFANVGMFIPFGLLVALQFGRRRWWVGWSRESRSPASSRALRRPCSHPRASARSAISSRTASVRESVR